MDKSFPLNPKPPKGLFEVGTKNVTAITSGDKTQITMTVCWVLPPTHGDLGQEGAFS